MRERLIELITNAPRLIFKGGRAQGKTYQTASNIADHLLANGVIVPPCKVGETLYFLYNNPYADKPDLTPKIYKTTDWYFKVYKTGIVINTSDIHSFNKAYAYHLGKNVFLTREEAEKALAERSNR